MSIEKKRGAWDPEKVQSRSHVFKIVLEESQQILYFDCESACQLDSVVLLIEKFLIEISNNHSSEDIFIEKSYFDNIRLDQ